MGKRWLCMALSVLLLLIPFFAEAAGVPEQAERRVCGLGLMEGDENGDLRFEAPITRAEFAVIALRLKLYGPSNISPQDTVFSDVSAKYWASGAIAVAHSLGIVSGDSEGTFRPDAYVSFDEALKILVSVAGYDVTAQELGGYPDGYYLTAVKLGIAGDEERGDGVVSRGQVCIFVNNVLDVVPLDKTVGTEEYVKNSLTLYELYQRELKIQEIEGIVQETETVSLLSDSISVQPGTVKIEGRAYDCEQDVSEMLGFRVKGYVKRNEQSGRDEIIAVSPAENQNRSWKAEPDRVALYTDHLTVAPEGKSDRSPQSYRFDPDMVCVHNGRKTDAPRLIYDGCYRAVDSDCNGTLDVLFVEESESFVVDRINRDTGMIFFANRQTYRGKTGLEIRLDDSERIYQITDAQGDDISYSEILPGSGLTIMASENLEYVRIFVSEEQIEGKLTEVREDRVRIDETEYRLAKTVQGEWSLRQYLDEGQDVMGIQRIFVLDFRGCVIGIADSAGQQEEIFGYVVQATAESGLENTVKFRLLQGMRPKKEIKVLSGNEKIYYDFQNEKLQEYRCASRFKIDGGKPGSHPEEQIINRVVKLKLNNVGEVREITTYDVPAVMGKHEFNGKILSFGGQGLERGFSTDEDTVFICLPKIPDEEEDYYVRVQLTDESNGNEVYGINADHGLYGSELSDAERLRRQEAEPVEVLLISAYMDASQNTLVPDTADICIVGSVSAKLGEVDEDEGAEIFTLELLNGRKKVTVDTRSSGAAFEQVRHGLKKGDLIRYTTDGYGRLERLDILAGVQGLSDYGEKEAGYYGAVSDLQQNFYDFQVNEMIDELTVYLGGNQQEQVIRLFLEDGQPIYLYDRDRGWISTATTDDIVTLKQTDQDEATKIFVLMKDNDAQAIVLIQD